MMIERIPSKRFCTEADVVGFASYLASPAADYVTGANPIGGRRLNVVLTDRWLDATQY
jgi:NAD(P)-dependent dehydrogenase (short-subunit alcohol dehydrogenase family)